MNHDSQQGGVHVCRPCLSPLRRAAGLTIAVVLLALRPAAADPPVGYYAAVDTTDASTARATISDAVSSPYDGQNFGGTTTTNLRNLWEDINNPDNLILLYSQRSEPKLNGPSSGGGEPCDSGDWNREHMFPRSFYDAENPYAGDLHALAPSDVDTNQRRSNNAYGFVATGGSSDACGDVLGVHAGGFTVFQPMPEARGEAARGVFYMDLRFEGEGGERNLVITDTEPGGTGLNEMAVLADLIAWHLADPPDENERWRNTGIQAIQLNRNPFIDHPEWVNCIYNGDCDTQLPQPPAELAGVTGVEPGAIDLSWSAVPGVSAYNVYRRTTPTGRPRKVNGAPVTATVFTDLTGVAATTFHYFIRSIDENGFESFESALVAATTPGDNTPPAAPAELAAIPDDSSVSLEWNANTEVDLAGYNVYRTTTPGVYDSPLNPALLTATAYLDQTVENGTTYSYVVRAVDLSTNESISSNEVTVTPNAGVTSELVINELDADLPSETTGEFVELHNSSASPIDFAATSFQVVLFNGNGDTAYEVFDITSGVVSPGGFVVIARATDLASITADVEIAATGSSQGWLQNGPDAVALYEGTPLAEDASITLADLADAVVYDTNDPDDAGLLVLMTDGIQVNESGTGQATVRSLGRLPDADGSAREGAAWKELIPTPGRPNADGFIEGFAVQ